MLAYLLALLGGTTHADLTPTELAAQPRTVEAARTRQAMQIDGHPDEEVWQRAPLHDDFIMRHPELGATPLSRTTLRVAYDDLALYVLVEAEMDPDEIVLRTLRRDAFAIFSDDAVSVKIDPRHDRRTALVFSTNTSGTQLDMMNLEDGRVGLPQWDAVWQVEVWRHDNGYTVEFRLPFAILGIKDGSDHVMGLNISRDHQSANATYDWRLMLPPRRPTSASGFGVVSGIDGVKAARALEISPYIAGHTNFEREFRVDPRATPNLSAGGDLRMQVGASSYVEASVLTDFAQVEADEVQVARDRFPLFFPERRPFFINGLDAFNFGREGEAQLFFSRRIGLIDGRAVPVGAGVKAYGRTAKLSYGLLNVQTLRSLADDEVEDELDIAPENFTVGRVRYMPWRQLAVGAIALGKHRFGDTDEAAFSAGADVDVTGLGGKFRWYSFFAETSDHEPDGEEAITDELSVGERADTKVGRSAATSLSYDGLYVRPGISVVWSDRQFAAPLGFYRRPGTASHGGRFFVAPRPRVLGLREIEVGPYGQIVTTPDYTEVLTADAGGKFEANWRNSWEAEYEARYRDDRVDEAFELYDYEIDARRYGGMTHELRLQTPQRFAVSGEAEYAYSQPFAGRAHGLTGRLTAKFSKYVSIEGSYTHLLGHLADPGDRFSFGFANAAINMALNRNVAWDTSLRLNLEPGEEAFAVQSRLRWRYRPGSDIFLVYTTSQPMSDPDPDEEDPAEPFHALTLKATYYFRALLGR